MMPVEVRQKLDQLLEAILPGSCMLCGLPSPRGLLCTGCTNDLPRIGPCCTQCGLPGETGRTRLCSHCSRRSPAWDDAIAALVYEYPIDHLVRRFKFRRNLSHGQLLAEELVRALRSKIAAQHQADDMEMPDALVPVPLHYWRRFRRGFNQAEMLARVVQQQLGIPLQSQGLRRVVYTPAQSGLDRKARRKNLRGAFRAGDVDGMHIALVDDVLTTGTTLQECSLTLKRAGARRVSAWVAARVPNPETTY